MSTMQTSDASTKSVKAPKSVKVPKVKRAPTNRAEHEIAALEKAAETKQLQTLQADQISAPSAMSFAVQQLSAPTALLNDFEKELEALKAKHGITAKVKILKTPEARTPREPRVQLNGITRPAESTTCGLIWGKADSYTADGKVAQISQLMQDKDLADINVHTIKTQYARWRQFNGIKGRLV